MLGAPEQSWKLCKYPVTVEEYQRFVDARGYEEPRWWGEGWTVKDEEAWEAPGSWEQQLETPNRPVVHVSWWEAMAYCEWLSDLRGKTFRLPTEAEWELAAKHPSGDFPWGGEPPSQERCNHVNNFSTTTPVGIFPSGNGLQGFCDLGGNVWEWCLDSLQDGNRRPARGGAWDVVSFYIRPTFRGLGQPRKRSNDQGFRLFHDAAPQPEPEVSG